MSQSARTQTILRRFPLHLGADDPGKLFTDVVAGLGGELDVKSVQLGRVRRAHALGDAGEERDLFLLAGLHDLRSEDFELTRIRLAATDAAARVLGDEASTDDDRTAATAKLPDLLGLQSDAFPAWPDEDDDPGPAETRLGAALSDLASYPSELDLLRGAVESVIRLHREGNGTISALLGAGAAHLELELGAIVDARDEY